MTERETSEGYMTTPAERLAITNWAVEFCKFLTNRLCKCGHWDYFHKPELGGFCYPYHAPCNCQKFARKP